MDADHGGDQVSRRSRTGILIYVNKAPILWYSKRQSTVETSTYGSELVAMRLAVDMIKALKYKLWMFGIGILDDYLHHVRIFRLHLNWSTENWPRRNRSKGWIHAKLKNADGHRYLHSYIHHSPVFLLHGFAQSKKCYNQTRKRGHFLLNKFMYLNET